MNRSMKTRLRTFVQRAIPGFFHRFNSYCWHRYYRQRFGDLQKRARHLLYTDTQPRILSGPFSGMPYLDEIVWGPIAPKWLGCYELELHDIVEGARACGYDRVINVGCAEGYYAVGLAWRMPEIDVVAFDIDPIARAQTKRLAAMVGVSARIKVSARCGWARLDHLISDRTLVLIDTEGDESNLLNLEEMPRLKNADLIVEVHEDDGVGSINSVEQTLRERFEETHQLTWRRSTDRKSSVEQFAPLWKGKICEEEFCAMLDEGRPVSQTWLWARAKHGNVARLSAREISMLSSHFKAALDRASMLRSC
jgi:hypothetical protein